jgi:hypothetical protein
MAFGHEAHSEKLFQLLVPGLFHVSLLKANRGLKLSRNSQEAENDHLEIYSLW